MSTHNICFCGEITKILSGYPLLSVAKIHVCFFMEKYEKISHNYHQILHNKSYEYMHKS